MEAKLRQLMKHEGINSTRLAEILGIQASGISHIMSGRNKPSFDFMHKLLGRFPQINPDWLILDKGPMYRDEIKNKSGQNTPGSANFRPGSEGAGTFHSAGAGTNGMSAPSAASATGIAGSGAGVAGRPGFVGDVAVPYNAGGTGNAGASGELFGPDNNDIIPSGVQSGGYHGRGDAGGDPGAYPGAGPGSQLQSHGAQVAYNQTGGFTRSAMIERIVVFYKDKTFSEYQPE